MSRRRNRGGGIAVPNRIVTAVLCLIATGVLGACGSSSSSTTAAPATGSLAAGCRPVSAADQTVRTRAYVFLLHLGSQENMVMLTAAQAKSKHIRSGELMVGGSMAGMSSGAMNGHTSMRHLEVHICNRASGKVVTGAMPAITVVPQSGGTPEQIPVAVMQGVVSGVGDLHYGNNVALRQGASYRITVRLGAEPAAFKYTVPRGM